MSKMTFVKYLPLVRPKFNIVILTNQIFSSIETKETASKTLVGPVVQRHLTEVWQELKNQEGEWEKKQEIKGFKRVNM